MAIPKQRLDDHALDRKPADQCVGDVVEFKWETSDLTAFHSYVLVVRPTNQFIYSR